MTVAGLSWWAFNNFLVYASEGFDPLRYEYYARFGLPNYFLDTTSYRIVSILSFIYRFLPEYGGYIFVIALIAIGLRYVDGSAYISTAIFSPISFYYLSQTGKDGIAILALIAMMIIAFDFKKIEHLVFCGLIVGLAIFVRPPILIYLPMVILQTRFGTRAALLVTPLLIVIFNYSIDIYDTTSSIENLTDDAGAGAAAQFLRRYSLGYDIAPILVKIFLFCFSPIFQPAIGVVKFITSGETFVLLESISYGAFLFLLWKQKIILRFFWASLPYCVALGATSPFYHFRYLAIVYPVIFVYARYAPRKILSATRESVDRTAPINSR